MDDAPRLLERELELERIDRLLAAALAGRGGLVLVEGPAGIGKTRLLDAVRARAAERGMSVLAARASELDAEFPFAVVRQLLLPPLAGGAALRRELLRGAAARAVHVLEHDVPDEGGAVADPAWAHFHALYWLVANLAERAPVALAIDDAHWADVSSLRFVQ